jgi:hypothetical protein
LDNVITELLLVHRARDTTASCVIARSATVQFDWLALGREHAIAAHETM